MKYMYTIGRDKYIYIYTSQDHISNGRFEHEKMGKAKPLIGVGMSWHLQLSAPPKACSKARCCLLAARLSKQCPFCGNIPDLVALISLGQHAKKCQKQHIANHTTAKK